MKKNTITISEEALRTVDVKINGVEHSYICTQQEAHIIAHTLKDLFGISCRITTGINGLFADGEENENKEELTDYAVTVS